jgi:cephalosporin-C deacetylase-like acetyl esterase
MKLCTLVLLALVAEGVTLICSASEAPVKNFFAHNGNQLVFEEEAWSIRAGGDKGWESLLIGGEEFFCSDSSSGAFQFSTQDADRTFFPDLSNISHDRMVGRMGIVGDGIHMIKITPCENVAELYAGANSEADGTLTLFLHPTIDCIRAGGVGERTLLRTIVTKNSSKPVLSRKAVIISPAGRSLVVSSELSAGKDMPAPEFEVGLKKNPSGQEVLAITFPFKKFAANSYQLKIEPEPREENFVVSPTFRVASSDDPALRKGGPVEGVINPVYGPDTKLDFGMEFGWRGGKPFRGRVELEVIHALGSPHYSEKIDLDGITPVDGKISATFHPKFTMPGVSDVWLRLVDAEGRLIWVDRYRMGYDLAAFKPDIRVEPDFEAYWKTTLAELRKNPLDAHTERVKEFEDAPDFEVYKVRFNGWAGKPIHALLYVPRDGKKPFPAIVTAHPGTKGFGINKGADGVYGSKIKQDRRFVTIAPLIRGHEPDAADIPFNHPWWGPLEDRETYVARSWYCAMVRAVDYLVSRPDLVDAKKIIAMGGSQGGALALVTAGLDSRIAYCFADCPANGQPHEIMNSYASFGPSRGVVPKGKSPADVEKLLSYFNPVNFAALISCPTHIGSNIGDLTVHSMGPLAAYQNLKLLPPDQKAFHPGFTHSHGSGPGLSKARAEILTQLAGPPPAP